MSAPFEILITSDGSGQLWNACVWDIQTGASLLTYRGGSTGSRSLCVLGGDYLIGADSNKPLLHMWSLQKKDQSQMRIVCPGRVNSLAVSPDGSYCVAGIAEKLHVWQVCSGNLLAVVSRHYQNISAIKFTDDGSHFVSAAEDNLIIVWSLTSVVAASTYATGQIEPRHVWTSHSLPVTDLHVGAGGVRARVVSSSLDHTCKLWDITSGSLLCTFVFDVSIVSVTMDSAEFRIFAGGANGVIFAVNMYGQPMKTEQHISSTEKEQCGVTCFKGHEKQVTQLSVSLDGTGLVSGSHDCTCRVWDIFSGQCLRTLTHKGIVTNAFVMLTPRGVANPDTRPLLPVQQFKRHLHASQGGDKNTTETLDVRLLDNSKSDDLVRVSESRDVSYVMKFLLEETRLDKLQQNTKTLENEVSRLKAKNKQLYEYCVETILDSKVK